MFDFMNRIHDLFHMFLLKSYKKSSDSNNEPPPIKIENNSEWEKKIPEQSDLSRLVSIFHMMIKIFTFKRFVIINHKNEISFGSNSRIS